MSFTTQTEGAIHSTKIPTGPTGKSGPPQKVDQFFRNFSGWTEPIHWVLDRNFHPEILVEWIAPIHNHLTWSQHIFEVKKSFVNKLNLLKRSSFLSRDILKDVYLKTILPSVSYALPIWGSFTNKDRFLALESLRCRAAKLINGLTRDMPSVEILKIAKWDSLHFMYKVKLATLAYKIFYDCTPPSIRLPPWGII